MERDGRVEELAERLVRMFAARLAAVGGGVRFCAPALLADTVAGAVEAGLPVVVTPELSRLAGELRDRGTNARVGARGSEDAPPGHDGLEGLLRSAGTGVTECLTAVASSGTIVVGPGGGNGGLIAALPPLHVAILHEADIRESLAEALGSIEGRFAELGGECVFVTGPSRTADIEMLSVVGVHGPVSLEVIVVREEA